jgi:precorrin-2 dehydrogenase/sirohydrochlorin ferrochelatase
VSVAADPMPHPTPYPVVLLLEGRECLVVGGGPVAARKAEGLLAAGALVTVVAEAPCADMMALAGASAVQLLVRRYRPGEAADHWLVITASDAREENQQVHDDAVAARVWVNSADDPDRCAFTLPAVHRQGAVTVTASTGGASPALASWLRDHLATAVGPEFAELAEQLSQRRGQLRALGEPTEGRDWAPLIEQMLERLRSLERSAS